MCITHCCLLEVHWNRNKKSTKCDTYLISLKGRLWRRDATWIMANLTWEDLRLLLVSSAVVQQGLITVLTVRTLKRPTLLWKIPAMLGLSIVLARLSAHARPALFTESKSWSDDFFYLYSEVIRLLRLSRAAETTAFLSSRTSERGHLVFNASYKKDSNIWKKLKSFREGNCVVVFSGTYLLTACQAVW